MLVTILVCLLILYYIVDAIIAWRKLRHFPGPFLASFSLLWLFRVALSGKAYKIRMALRHRYGEGMLIRISPDMLITDDPGIFQRINGVHNGYNRGDWYSVMRFDPYQHTMISSTDTAFHDDVKARMAAGYTGREVPAMECEIDEQIANLKSLFERKYLSTDSVVKPMDWGLVAQYFTLDALTKVAFGDAFGYLETDSDVYEYIKTVEDSTLYFALCSDIPWIGKILTSRLVLRLAGPSVSDRTGLGVTMAVAKQVVSARFDGNPEALIQQDMLASPIPLSGKKRGSFIRHGLPRRQCEAELPTQLVAGSDTTANFLRTALLFIATIPHVYHRLQNEIDDAISSGQISNPATNVEAKKLSYLQAFLLESLRFSPPISLLFPKVVPAKGDILESKSVPGGTKIAVDFWSMGRRTDIYGQDAMAFRPERFLDATPEKRAVMERTTDLMFGYGRYMCPGKAMAWLEMNKLFIEVSICGSMICISCAKAVVKLLRDFDFQVLDPEMPLTRSHHALFVVRNMRMRVTKRCK
ncbi:cytochrome p450 [Rhypophila decipiens]|uniref:Cytochrome p450 n=1 Tax=Rhypophila decipiens TaxID=261697 RepID=A0AAN6YAR9_9PEZI|nr:cytochrome p450 [Rhypophila decipiens]